MKKFLKQFLLILIVVVLLIFLIQNFSLLELKFINWKVKIPVFVALMLIYFLGTISGSLLFSLIRDVTTSKEKKRDGDDN